MISPVEPRRLSDDSEIAYAHRQSTSDVFSEKKVLGHAPPPASAPIFPAPSLPLPFTSAPPPRPFADTGSPDKNPSPRMLYPPSSGLDSALPALESRLVSPPLDTFPRHRSLPPIKLEQLEAEQRHAEAQFLSGGHRPQPLPSLPAGTARGPPGQLSLSSYPVSPKQNTGPDFLSRFEPRGPPSYEEEGHYSPHRQADHKAAFDKHFQTNGYQNVLQAVGFAFELRTRHAKGEA